ncbi:MAG: glycoside hydrolase family 5 protein [Solirubrobacteraceae bacterium]
MLRISGNQFVDASGQPLRLFGAHLPTSEEVCVEPIYNAGRVGGVFDGVPTDATFAAMRSWHINVVRIPLNEQCWLGVNPVRRDGGPHYGITPLSGRAAVAAGRAESAHYQAVIKGVVAMANRDGLAVILDLHWSAAGNAVAFGQWPLPDRQYSIPFWRSVATAFRADPSVAFELFNEPFQRNPRTLRLTLSWRCLRDGCAGIPNACADCSDGSQDHPNIDGCGARCPTEVAHHDGKLVSGADGTYTSAGTQTLVDTIRATGAREPILVPGRDYTNDLSQWLHYMPHDPLGQIAATFHAYQGLPCDTVACWDRQVAPVAAHVPVLTTEFGGDLSKQTDPCPRVVAYDNSFMGWADAHGVHYIGFSWDVDFFDYPRPTCSYDLLADAGGTPRYGHGQAIHDHFVAVAPAN